ncbi:MAG: helix-turn-helix transcriptional regulator [Flavobacteriales bacterium]|nr:helix-turn-helix transcriptional regulator [Flavobacteriales bacterium]
MNKKHIDIDIYMKNIGETLRMLRKRKGYTSAEIFAYENSLNRVSYWRIENGQNFTMKMLIKILEIHQMSLSEFFTIVDNEKGAM